MIKKMILLVVAILLMGASMTGCSVLEKGIDEYSKDKEECVLNTDNVTQLTPCLRYPCFADMYDNPLLSYKMDTELQSNGIKVLLLQGQVFKNGVLLDLTAVEYKLLCLFMRNPNMVLTKEQILDRLWDCDGNYIDSSTLTVYMRRLRMKIEDNPSEPQMLRTVRGIHIKWKVLPSAVQITVKDNGCGIHPEDLYHIFKRFYRSRFSKDIQGIGLGLPLAKAIIEAHGGLIEVESELGLGTSFIMNFPIPTKL